MDLAASYLTLKIDVCVCNRSAFLTN